MRRVQGASGVKLLECTNPVRDKWRIRWDVREDDGGSSYMEEDFSHRPTDEEISQTVNGWINKQTTSSILSGFMWEGARVWLSTENQLNYKAAHDLAVQTIGATLPVTFKFDREGKPYYRTFNAVEELTAFYTAAVSHINNAIAEGWKMKDGFRVEDYRLK